jgi:hypothetical protein
MFQLQKISSYGTTTPSVARTVLQGSDLLGFFLVPDEQKERYRSVLFELMRHLLRCVEIRDRISAEVVEGQASVEKTGLQFQTQERAVSLPGVADLRSKILITHQDPRLREGRPKSLNLTSCSAQSQE